MNVCLYLSIKLWVCFYRLYLFVRLQLKCVCVCVCACECIILNVCTLCACFNDDLSLARSFCIPSCYIMLAIVAMFKHDRQQTRIYKVRDAKS